MDSIPLMSQVVISGHLDSLDSVVMFNYDEDKLIEQIASCSYNVDNDIQETENIEGTFIKL